jgi:hypothetical protein
MLIPARAFDRRKKLTEVELYEGLLEIGESSFAWCGNSISKINIPNSLRRINDGALEGSLRCPIRLHDGIESIGGWAFRDCIFTNFRFPPLITMIPDGLLSSCKSMFSVEMPKIITEIGNCAFMSCYCLRNVAFPSNAVIEDNIFTDEEDDDIEIEDDTELRTDLQILFGSELEIIRNVKHRFDELPVHSSVYYQPYHQGALQCFISSGNELDPTGNQQDCLGMTPLHILACSSVHNLEMYHLIVEKYPANLITEDRWGALPILYAFWGVAPTVIILFLLESYQSCYPDHEFNWTVMVITLGQANATVDVIQNLLDVQHTLSPGYTIDWDRILVELARTASDDEPFAYPATFCFLTRCSIATRVSAIGVKP